MIYGQRSIDLNVACRNIFLQKHPHNAGIGKALDGSGISIDKHGHTGFSWTKDKLGMYHGEARLGDKPIVYWLLGEK